MKVYTHTTDFPANWNDVSYAIFNKYPNPFSSHVLQSDVLDRKLEHGVLHTVRLHVKTGGGMPKWASSLFKSKRQAFILEESSVDTTNQHMVTHSRNLDLRKYLYVQETQHIFPNPDDPQNQTRVVVTAKISSNFGGMHLVSSQVEKFGHSKFRENLSRSMLGLTYVLDSIRARMPRASGGGGASQDGSHA